MLRIAGASRSEEAKARRRRRMTETSPDTVVRTATPADLRAMGVLGAALVTAHHEFDSERFLASTPTTARAYADFLGRELQNPKAILLVAECSGRVAGYAYAGLEGTDYMALRGPAGVLYDLVVDPALRRRGIGRTLLEATVAALAVRDAPRVVLFTAEKNGIAQRLFAACGFRRTMVEMTRELGNENS
jgi:ribosomal protein S18 acetylase RimI-like enzyme